MRGRTGELKESEDPRFGSKAVGFASYFAVLVLLYFVSIQRVNAAEELQNESRSEQEWTAVMLIICSKSGSGLTLLKSVFGY